MMVILAISYFKLDDVKNVANRISDIRTPTVNASNQLKNNINTALADLRGWMLLKEEQFLTQRKASWKNIREAQRALTSLSENWTNPENVTRLNEVKILLDDYVAKPIDPTKLRRTLMQWLPSGSSVSPVSEDVAAIIDESVHDNEQTDTLIFDYEVMNSMLMGDKEMMSTISDTFLEDMALQIEQLKSILDTDDTIQVAAISHKIKGASGNVGGKVLSASALEMEMAGKADDMETVRQVFEKLENDFTALKDEMVRKLA